MTTTVLLELVKMLAMVGCDFEEVATDQLVAGVSVIKTQVRSDMSQYLGYSVYMYIYIR